MSKGERNRQKARERIAQMRALEARRRRRHRRLAGAGAALNPARGSTPGGRVLMGTTLGPTAWWSRPGNVRET